MGTMHANVSLPTASPTHLHDSRSASLVGQWRSQLLQLHFTTWRIDHDLQAVNACLRDLGPVERWSDAALRLRFARRRGGRAVDNALLEEVAVQRFRRFAKLPDEVTLQTEILAAWLDRLLVCGRKRCTREKYRDAVLRYVDFAGPIWRGSLRTMDRYSVRQVSANVARETLRGCQGAVARFRNFVADPAEGWAERVFHLTGAHIPQLCTPANTLAHVHTCPEGQVGRGFTDAELRTLFGHLRRRVDAARRLRRKGAWTASRDFAMYQFMLATGARDSDLEGLRMRDLLPAYGDVAGYSVFEEAHFLGKSDPGGPPKPRIVHAIALFSGQWHAFDWYLRAVRPRLLSSRSEDFVFLSERGGPLGANDISRIFHACRVGAGLPEDLHAHCLRHSFAQRLRQADVDLAIIQALMGHNAESTTARYAKLTPRYIKDRLLACSRRQRGKGRARG